MFAISLQFMNDKMISTLYNSALDFLIIIGVRAMELQPPPPPPELFKK